MYKEEVYRELIDKAARSRSNEVLPNSGPDHASIAMAKLFENTNSIVRMIVNYFDGRVSDNLEYLNTMQNCIDRNVHFKILVVNAPSLRSKAYNMLIGNINNGKNIELRQATEESKEILTKNNNNIMLFSV